MILIKAAANGSPLVADLRYLNELAVPTPIAIRPKGSKVERLSIQSHRIEAGDVHLPTKAVWLETFLAEMQSFPHGRHDDQADALSQLLAWADRDRRFENLIFAPPIIIYG